MKKLTNEIFIIKSKLVHAEKYNYSQVNYINNHTKVKIFCNKCKEYFMQTPSDHLKNRGCPKCAGKALITNETFMVKAKLIHGEKYDYLEVQYVNNKTKVKIFCNNCKEYFMQTPTNHLNAHGCAKCENKKLLTKEEFIIRAKSVHGNKYDYFEVKYVNNHTKVKIFCKKCKTFFLQKPNDHLQNHGCEKCGYAQCSISLRTTKDKFIEKAIVLHGSKYDYSKSKYINNKTKIKIFCNKCKEYFMQNPTDHLQGHGCAKCVSKKPLTTEEFVEKAQLVHGNNYDYSQVNYINSYTKVKIFCKKCEKFFLQNPNIHINNHGCPKCGCAKCGLSHRLTKEKFIEKALILHKSKYDYLEVEFVDNYTKVKIFCKKCNTTFFQAPYIHLSGCGCTRCSKSISKKANQWLDSFNICLEKEKVIIIDNKIYKVDGFYLESNTIYEFYGDYWHGNPKIFSSNEINRNNKKTFGELYNKTMERENILKNAGFKIISIWESDFDKAER